MKYEQLPIKTKREKETKSNIGVLINAYIWAGLLLGKCMVNKVSMPPNIYLFKVINRNIGKRCEIISKLTLKTPVIDVVLSLWYSEHIPHLFSGISIAAFELLLMFSGTGNFQVPNFEYYILITLSIKHF